MPKGLHALAEVPPDPDHSAMVRFLALIPETGNQSFFKDVVRVRPGEICIVTSKEINSYNYWTPSREPLRLRSSEYEEALREQMDRAVSDRLRGAKGRVAAHLSGGLDSSTVAATAARLLVERGRVTAFTAVPRRGYSGAVPRGRFADESLHAVSVAMLYPNMQHVLVETSQRSPLANLERNFFLYERPMLNLCNGVWSDAILDGAKSRGLTVMLTGQMGNASFSHSGLDVLPDLLLKARWFQLAQQALRLHRNGLSWDSLAAHTFGSIIPRWLWRAANRLRGRRHDLSHSGVNREAVRAMHAATKSAGLDFSQRPRRDGFDLRLWVFGRVDFGNYTKGFLGGWGIDVRDPTADRRLLEFSLRIPAAEYLKDGRSRSIARRAFADRLPQMILKESRSGLQAADWHEGLSASRDDLARELERIVACPGAEEILQIPMLERLVNEWPEGDWNSLDVQRRYRLALLRGISGGHFFRKASGSNG